MFKRVLLAASVAAVFAAPAFAEVTIYGSARTSLEYSKSAGVSRVRLVDESSRLGFKGSDKLDNGMTVFWKSEHRIRVGASELNGTNNASTGFGNRDSYVGVESKAGTFTFGKQVDSYGDWTLISPVLDGVVSNSEDSNLYQFESGARKNNIAKYVSPVFSGFQVSASYDFGSRTKTATSNVNSYGYSTLLTWSNDMFNVGAAYLGTHDDSGTVGEKLKAYALGGGVKIGSALTVSGHWEHVKFSQADSKRDYFGIGANYAVGKWGFNALALKANEKKVAGVKQDDGAYQINLGARYALSKQTTALANVTFLDNDTNGEYTTATAVGSKGARAGTVSLGLRTDF
ncbi:MAG: hypothetical protein H6R07_3334 [Proteobacteria bacterium]|nr:hypothetical protein [Pseudomonadota bacterium]